MPVGDVPYLDLEKNMFQNNCAKISHQHIKNHKSLVGEITVPGDKSISHRSIMFGALASGKTRVTNFLRGADCLATIDCFRKLGIGIEDTVDEIIVNGKGLYGLKSPSGMLDVKNSGTTMRLLSGILAGQSFESEITGDASIQKRPMKRIMDPLKAMGADITSINDNNCAPLKIRGGDLKGIEYDSPVSSAQVKSCVLLAGMYADSPTTLTEPVVSRNHTEMMLTGFGADLKVDHRSVTIFPDPKLEAQDIAVAGDISSAAYFIAGALLVPGSELLIRNVGVNPTRDGIIQVAKAIGGNISLENQRIVSGEPVADILVKYSKLHGIRIEKDIIPTLIDELPVIAVMAALAEGQTVIADAAELKVKESDRIMAITQNLTDMGGKVVPTDDGMIIDGVEELKSSVVKCYNDHRIAMSFYVAGLTLPGTMLFDNANCVDISYPTFFSDFGNIIKK